MANEKQKLDNQLCFRLYTASRLMAQAYEPLFKPFGITYTQYLVLMVLWEKDEQPVNDIGKRLYLGINTTSQLVARRDSETDKRQQIVYLTAKGKAMKRRAKNIPDCIINKINDSELKLDRLISIAPLLDEFIEKMSK